MNMNFELKGRIVFSKSIETARDSIKKFIDESAPLLTKGAPEGRGAKVIAWNISGRELQLTITSERWVRAHEGMLRLRKALSQFLGREHKIGAREMFIDDYKITFPLEIEVITPFTIPFAHSVEFNGKECTLVLKDVDEEFLQRRYIDRMISLIKEKVNAQYYEGKGEHWELLWSSPKKDEVWRKDPSEEMLRLGWVKQGPTKGKFFFGPKATKILRVMEKIALEEVLLPLGFQEVIGSHIVNFDTWIKTGHLEGMPMELYYVCEPKTRDLRAWEHFIDNLKITRNVPVDELENLITKPKGGICYAQCPVIYWAFSGKTLALESLPVKIFDRAANSCRYESGGRHGIERVDEFHRIEPVYIGTPEQLVEIREQLIERYKTVFNEILDLGWRMAWVTPFYMQQAGRIGELNGEKIKGTIDFEAYMPYRGEREESEWLEFQNLTIAGDIYLKPFNIKAQKGELWSGCSGIGLERWTAVFLAQKGLDPKDWPSQFRKKFGEMPKDIKIF